MARANVSSRHWKCKMWAGDTALECYASGVWAVRVCHSIGTCSWQSQGICLPAASCQLPAATHAINVWRCCSCSCNVNNYIRFSPLHRVAFSLQWNAEFKIIPSSASWVRAGFRCIWRADFSAALILNSSLIHLINVTCPAFPNICCFLPSTSIFPIVSCMSANAMQI